MLRINVKHLFIVVFLGLMASSCDDDSLSHEEHTDADGLVLELNGQEVYREFEGDIVINNLTLNVGDTLELSVHFLDHDGDEVEHDEDHDEDEGLLSITVADASIATVTPEEHDAADADEHEMAIEIVGLAEGATSFTLALMHGDHADYTATNSVAITVIAGN